MSLKQNVIDKLTSMNISPKRSLGQNFLVGEHVIQKIISRVLSHKPKQLIEVGPGLGALTEHLVTSQIPLKLVELDREFCNYWRSQNQDIWEGDALKWDWSQVEKETVLVSNLPYQIGGHLVVDRSLDGANIKAMVLMFQKEVAQRIAAQPANKDYGFLTVVAQSFWYVDTLVDAGPAAFYPAPNISSRVLNFIRKPEDVDLAKGFVDFVKAAFQQRRKLLVKNLNVICNDKSFLIECLEGLGLGEKVRAENLSPEQFIQLYKQIERRRGN